MKQFPSTCPPRRLGTVAQSPLCAASAAAMWVSSVASVFVLAHCAISGGPPMTTQVHGLLSVRRFPHLIIASSRSSAQCTVSGTRKPLTACPPYPGPQAIQRWPPEIMRGMGEGRKHRKQWTSGTSFVLRQSGSFHLFLQPPLRDGTSTPPLSRPPSYGPTIDFRVPAFSLPPLHTPSCAPCWKYIPILLHYRTIESNRFSNRAHRRI